MLAVLVQVVLVEESNTHHQRFHNPQVMFILAGLVAWGLGSSQSALHGLPLLT